MENCESFKGFNYIYIYIDYYVCDKVQETTLI